MSYDNIFTIKCMYACEVKFLSFLLDILDVFILMVLFYPFTLEIFI